LGLAERPTAVQAASLVLRLPDQSEQLPDPHTSIVQAYERAQQELLILGEPGAGKSTQLLVLAKHLLEQAEQDGTQPLPVVLPLSSWATKQLPLHNWLVEQVALLYNVSGRVSQQWLQREWLLPLLDGLDEVEEAKRPACIAAINFYHREHVQPLVVCSRTNEYEAASTHECLVLHTAVVVQPLSLQQVNTYLEGIGRPVVALRAALKNNTELAELATTPLMLQVLILTYQGTEVQELAQKEVQLQQQIWDDYVERMVNRKGDTKRYPLGTTITSLGWLAHEMRRHNQVIFFLEQLDPNWLPPKTRVLYRWSFWLVAGLFFGLVIGLPLGLVAGLVEGLVAGLLFGLLAMMAADEEESTGLGKWPSIGLFWLTFWLILGLLLTLALALVFGLYFGLVAGLRYGLVAGLHTVLVTILNDLGLGLLPMLVASALVLGLLSGLGAALQRYTLGFSLWRTSLLPWQAVPFLEDATARILLRRVGRGYSFTHRLLLDYFADLDVHPSLPSTAEPSTPSPTS